jgi:cell division protein FtsW (lipid II flippase)
LFKNVDKALLLLPFVFVVISVVMIGSTEYEGGLKISREIVIQLLAFALGVTLFLLSFLINYKIFHSQMNIHKEMWDCRSNIEG